MNKELELTRKLSGLIRKILGILGLVVLSLATQAARADSLTFQVNAQVTPISVPQLNSTLTGTFTINTNGIPFNYQGNSYSGNLPITSSFDVVEPDGSVVPLDSGGQLFIGSGSGGITNCSFTSGSFCDLLIQLNGPAGVQGFVVFQGTIGDTLGIIDGGEAESSQLFNFGGAGVFSEIHGSATPTPEPSVWMLILIGGLVLLAMKWKMLLS